VAENEYKIFVGAADLPGSTVAVSSYGGIAGGDYKTEREKFSRNARGQNDFASWGGWVSFDLNNDWHFDPNPDNFSDRENQEVKSMGQTDFFSTALHEIGHVLGIGTSATWMEQVMQQDGTSFFSGENVLALNDDSPVPLVPDEDHFANSTDGFGGGFLEGQEALMDPSVNDNQDLEAVFYRKLPTNLDYAALKDVGWEVSASPVPVPAAVWFFGSGLLGLFGIKKRRVE
jgi:hypothetical protein